MRQTEPAYDVSRLPRDQVVLLQEERLRRQLDYVLEHSPLYRRKFSEANIDARTIRSVSDLSRLPFTEKSELRSSQISTPPLGEHAAVPMRDVVRVHASSGTTGGPARRCDCA